MPRQFTITDVLIGLSMCALLAGGALPSVASRSREAAVRIKCSSNLRQVGLAMKMYAYDERLTQAYPRTLHDPDAPTPVWASASSFNDAEADNRPAASPWAGPGQVAANDVTAAMFLLLRTQDITPDVFVCPSTDDERYELANGSLQAGVTIQGFTNWTAGRTSPRSYGRTLSYSTQNPYPSRAAGKAGFIYNDSLTAEFAVMADMNSGSPSLLTTPIGASGQAIRELNSPNHDGDGQNVLYADGHVDWTTSPYVGIMQDNIYTANGVPPARAAGTVGPEAIVSSPAHAGDTVLLPTYPAGKSPGRSQTSRQWPVGIWIAAVPIGLSIVLLAAYFAFRSRSRGKTGE